MFGVMIDIHHLMRKVTKGVRMAGEEYHPMGMTINDLGAGPEEIEIKNSEALLQEKKSQKAFSWKT